MAKADPPDPTPARLRLGMPASEFHYVYILKSENSRRYYIGVTQHLKERLQKHNGGGVPNTAKRRPWRIENAFAFRSRDKANAFDAYLKSGSGREFARRNF